MSQRRGVLLLLYLFSSKQKLVEALPCGGRRGSGRELTSIMKTSVSSTAVDRFTCDGTTPRGYIPRCRSLPRAPTPSTG